MKLKLFPVILTAALTSVFTLYIAARFQTNVPYFAQAPSHATPVNYASFTSDLKGAGMNVSFEAAAAASVKASVHIKTTTKARTIVDDNVNDVYAQLFGSRQYIIPSQVESGSGVVISPDGYIITNNHVVANGDEVTVTFNDRLTTKAKVVAKDASTDIALLKVDGEKDLPFMEFGNSDDVKLGQWVLAVGYPLSLDATVTAGIVSAKGRSLGLNSQRSSTPIESYIQTDAAVNPGNSGGALVNTEGQLIGINSAIASPTGSYAGYSYAIPANIVRKVANDLMKFGSVQRAYLGIVYKDNKTASEAELKSLGLDRQEGVYVLEVLANGGAAAAGILKGDIITELNGQKVSTQPQLQEQVARYQPGDNVSVLLLREGKPLTLTVKFGKGETLVNMLGASFRVLTDKEKTEFNTNGGVMVTDIGHGALSRLTQMRKGFVITGVNDIPVNTVADLQQILNAAKSAQIQGFQPGFQGRYYYNINNLGAAMKEAQ